MQVSGIYSLPRLYAVASHHPEWYHLLSAIYLFLVAAVACRCGIVFKSLSCIPLLLLAEKRASEIDMRAKAPVIVVHGGAGTWQPERREQGIRGVERAAETGFEILKRGGTSLDAVEQAVVVMEDDEVFNAGLGSALTLDKKVEMEASIMDGATLKAGAASLLEDVKNPVKLARLVMENTDHIFIVGETARKLARAFKLETRNPYTGLREKYWNELIGKLQQNKLDYLPRLGELLKKHPELFELETVGAVAADSRGNVAAATSTGGFSLKLPGRIGDSPLIGCGTYADNQSGACSATGIGEIAIRLVLAKNVCDLIRSGAGAQEAVENSIRLVNTRMRGIVNFMGLIAVNPAGDVGAAHNSPNMCWAYMASGMGKPKAALKARIVKKTSSENDRELLIT